MGHMISKDTVTGRFQFAFKGERSAIWHDSETQGEQMPADATVEQMAMAAGWNFKVQQAYVRFATARDMNPADYATFEGFCVYFHSVSKHPFGVMSESFEPAQPKEMIVLADRICSYFGASPDSCGVTYDGAGLFMNLRMGDDVRIVGTDTLRRNFLLYTRNDGTTSTTGKSAMTRSVCENTIQSALGEGKHAADMRLSHRSEFVGARVAAQWVAMMEEQTHAAEQFKLLAQTPVSHITADALVFDLFNDKRTDAVKQSNKRDIRNSAGFQTIMGLFGGAGLGANMPGVKGTAWGLLNAITEFQDHHVTAKNTSIRWTNANFGSGADMKDAAFRKLLALATAD